MKANSIQNIFCAIACCLIFPVAAHAEDSSAAPKVTYGDKGWEFKTVDGRYLLQIQSRLQFRYATPFDTDPYTYDDFNEDDHQVFKVNRARLKVGGNAYEAWLKFFWEYELASGNMLDFRVMVTRYPSLNLKIGQWKAHFNRERVISSGKQQMADRSLINRPFTIDRQQGVSLYGRLKGTGAADFNYWISVFTGMGRGATQNDDDNLMYMARAQWNFLGRELKFSGSDIPYSEEATGLIALAAVTNRSPYTRFSTAGGGQLEGFDDGEPGQYRVNQWMAETAFKYRGFSWQQEFHWKEINDRVNESVTTLTGNYMQFGYFFHYALERIPEQLELALRHAFYKPDMDNPDNVEHEYSFAANWFFKGHLNKLTAEVSYFEFRELSEDSGDGVRFRIQWDISI